MKRGRPKNPIGAIRETENGRKAWNGKRWVSEAHFKTMNPSEEPKPQPQPAPEKPKLSEDFTGYKENPPKPIQEATAEEQSEPDPIIEAEELDDMFSSFADIIEPQSSEEAPADIESGLDEPQRNSVTIKGKHLVFIIDLFGSFLAAYIVKKSGLSKQERKDFKLTKEEREELEEVAGEAAETISIDLGNPWAALGMSYFALIAFKLERT